MFDHIPNSLFALPPRNKDPILLMIDFSNNTQTKFYDLLRFT